MPTKFADLHLKFQSNVYPSMLQDFADSIGVPYEALVQLDIGWVPIVKFEKGRNTQGWWAIPERDTHGDIVGLLLRSQKGFKVMYPGSKHGCVYAVNPNHEQGSTAYKPGAHNWVRTADHGEACPVCGKPDGCLLHADNPDDPQSVICCRVRTGSDRPLRLGHLHILKDEGRFQSGTSVIAPSDHPVLVVEGMTDTATALALGFQAVGRPSNLAGLDELSHLLRSRDVIIVGENDDVNPLTGERPGHEGVIATAQALRRVCRSVQAVFPPEQWKDLRQWWADEQFDSDQFLQYVEEHGDDREQSLVIPDDRDLTLARSYLHDQHRMAGRYTLRCFNNVWFRYAGGKYEYVPDLQVSNPLYQWAHDKFVQIENSKGETNLARIKATRHWVSNVVAAMNSEAEIIAAEAPCWINGSSGLSPRDLISFENGLLHIPSYLAGKPFAEYMMEPTPDLFTLASLPFPFDPSAKCPVFKKWARSSLGDEFDKVKLAQEYAGYCMTSDISHQKMLWLRGVPAAGKSLFIDVLRELVGPEQYADVKIRNLTERFGMTGMIGKLIAAIRDLRMPRHTDGMVALESILNIVGGDPVPIERKFKDIEASHRLMCRFIFSSNEMPQFSDPTGALKRRLLLIEFKRGFVGREDRDLPQKLSAEIPGIAVWALEGLRRLRDQGRFTEPQSMLDVLNDWHRDNSPVSTFIEECVEYDDDEFLSKRDVYDAFKQWATEHGHFPCSLQNFKQRWADRVPSTVSSVTKLVKGHKIRAYLGVKLVPWAAKAYLGKPTHE